MTDFITDRILLANRELEKLSTSEKIKYFSRLKEYCEQYQINRKKNNICTSIVAKEYHHLRNYEYEFSGRENIPEDGKAIFVCNHSNSHDILGAIEIFKNLGMPVSVLVASDDLNAMTNFVFSSCDAVLIDRRDKLSAERGVLRCSSNVMSGMPVFIFGEATWNLHPYKTMQFIKIGASNIAAIAEAPLIPTIFEYVEIPECCKREKDLYSKCIVRFHKPISISREMSLVSQTNNLQTILEQGRLKIWTELGITRTSLKDINQDIYLNHTYLKKFGAFGFTYDSESEAKFLFSKDGTKPENEFHLDSFGNFVPGITKKNEGKKYIKKI